MIKTAKIIVRNEYSEFVTLYLEPWGEDYGMLMNEEFEIIAKTEDEGFFFQVDFGKNIIVWADGQIVDIGVYHNAQLLQCGHNRAEAQIDNML
jgi:hypothetical protein